MIDVLSQRLRQLGGRPLLTYYDLGSGERTELSGASFANWVNKTTNLIHELDAGQGLVAAPLALSHPAHWMTLIWPLAAWQAGCGFTVVDRAGAVDTDLVVLGPDNPEPVGVGATVACSLHPLGLGLTGLPPGVVDFSSEALAQPDQPMLLPASDAVPAWRDAVRMLDRAAIIAVTPQPGRVLVRPKDAWTTLAEAIIAPLLGGGSAVLVIGDDGARIARIRATERCVE